MKDMRNIDSLLKVTLSSKEEPDELLNIKLKSALKRQSASKKTISLWWVPMTASIMLSIITMVLVKLFVFTHAIGAFINFLILSNLIFNILVTFIGIKFFNLKKGAEIKL